MGDRMADTTNTAEILITADASGVEAGLRQATTAAERAERQMSGGANNSARSQSNLIAAIQRTTAQMEAGSRTSARYWEITARQRGVDPAVLEPYLRQLRRLEEAQRDAANSAESAGDTIKKAIGSAVAGLSIAALGQQIISAQREFDKLNASLVTATGSADKAALAFGALQAFAATTPYGVAEATEAFIKMRNMGLDPSERALRSYGNTAAAMGKSLEQMVEAVADAATGEFERLKEFGIKASQNGEKVTLTFKGTSTTIKNEAEAIEKYLMGIGEIDFAGAMIQRAATLDGAISQLADSWGSAMRTISSSGIGQAAQDGVIGLSAAMNDLEAILLAISEAADKQASSLNGVQIVHKSLTTVFEAVSVLGVNVAYVLTQVGKELGGLAAQAKAVATGEFAQARIIGEMMKAEAERDRQEVDRKTAAILGAAEKAKKAAEGVAKKPTGEDVLAQFRIQREAERESEAAAKRRADQLKRETESLAELAGLTKTFAADWKMLSKLYADGKINLEGLTKAQADLLAKQPAIKAAADQEIKARKELDDFNKRYAEGLAAISGLYNEQIKGTREEADRNEEVARTYGMSAAAIAQEEVARLKNQLARASEEGLMLSEIEHLKEMIKLRERSAAALASVEAKDANAKAAEKATQDWQRSAEQIGQSLTDNLMRGGKSAADYLEDLFRTLILRPIIQPIGNAVGGWVNQAMGMPGAAQAGTGAEGGTNLSQSVANMYNALKSGGTLEQSIAKSVQAGFEKMGASSSTSSQAGAWAGRAGGTVAGYMIGSSINSGISSGYETGSGFMTAQKVGTAIASYFGGPIGGAIAGAISGLVNRAFGMRAKEFADTSSLVGSINAGSFAGTVNTAWTQEGGWFRSDKSDVDRTPVNADMAKQLGAGYEAIKAASADFAKTLGINADFIATRSQAVNIALTKDEEANKKAIADFFIGVGNTIAGELLPSLSQFQEEGEQASATLQRLATGYALVDTALTSIGMSFSAVGTSSLEARERLLAAAGGLDAFAANTAGFQQNFLTEAERNAPVLKSVREQLAAMGLSAVDTREEFKQTVLALDLTTEAGAKQYGVMMSLQERFAQLYPAMDATATAAAKLAEVNRPYQDQIRELELSMMSATDRRLAEIEGMDASTVALYDRRAALRLEVEAIAKAADAAKAASDKVAEFWRAQMDTVAQATAEAERQRQAAISQAMESSAAAQRSLMDAFAGGIDRAREMARSLRDLGDSMTLGDLSSLSQGAQYSLALKQLQAASPENIQSAAGTFLKASKDRDEGSLAYARDFAMVQQLIERAAGAKDQQAASLEWMGMLIRDRMLDGSHANGLDYVPFDGYRAELHRGERVQTAAEARGADAMSAAVERLAGIVERQGVALDRIARETKRQADGLEMVTNGWDGMRTTADE